MVEEEKMANKIFNNCYTEYFDSADPDTSSHLRRYLEKQFNVLNHSAATPVILCIGTDRATGDCLGPLVGEKLKKTALGFDIYGTLDSPVHALNLRDTINHIRHNYHKPYIIAIDAALGNAAHIGYITVSNCPMLPGKGVNKKLPAIGDVSITGIVNVAGRKESILQTTRLYTVMSLADEIADALNFCLARHPNYICSEELCAD
jgi:putative sporulation protein YyaC